MDENLNNDVCTYLALDIGSRMALNANLLEGWREVWGSHWPLGRGTSTGRTIDDRIDFNPGHNSLLTWGMGNRPQPLSTSVVESIDTLGKSRPMTVQKWPWLISMTDVSDERLIEWAQSFSEPPSIKVNGARLEFDNFAPERRAIRLAMEQQSADITLAPVAHCVDPVFELSGVRGKLASISLDGQALAQADNAWDGHTLWVRASIDRPRRLHLGFENK
jgi:hypothetical protein